MEEDVFLDYIGKVDSFYKEKTKQYNCFFTEENLSFAPLLRGIMYLIEQFLRSDKKSLFIKVPSFSFGKESSAQDKNHIRFTRAICDVLYSVTLDNMMSCRSTEGIEDGEIIYVSEKIPLKGSAGIDNSERFFKITNGERGRRAEEIKELRSSSRWSKYYPIREPIESFIKKYGDSILRLTTKPEGQWRGIVDKLNDYIGELNRCKFSASTTQFSKVLFVGTQKYYSPSILNSGIPVNIPVVFANDFNSVKDEPDYDLIIFCDNSHNRHTTSVQNKLRSQRDNLKKVIFIGEECDRYDCQFEFSNREWFHYFVGDSRYPTIKKEYIEFNWLRESVNELRVMLNRDEELPDEAKSRIVHRIFYDFMNAELPEDIKSVSKVRSIVGEEYAGVETNRDVLDSIVSWYQDLDIPEVTPKQAAINRIKKEYKRSFSIPRRNLSYKRNVADFLKEKNNKENCFIFEGVRKCKIEVFSNLLDLGALGTYYFLYYDNSDIKYLEDYIAKEASIYMEDYRLKCLDNIYPTLNKEISTQKTLEDYFDVRLFDEIEKREWNGQDKYKVYFESGAECLIDGEVIHNSKRVKISDIYDSKDYLGKEITYYYSFGIFGEIISLYKGQRGEAEQYYSNLWKSKLKQMFEEKAGGDIGILSSFFNGIRRSNLLRYLRTEDGFMREDSMVIICSVLSEHGYIDIQEGKYILAARNSRDENSSHGRPLKDELYDLLLKKKTVKDTKIVKGIIDGGKEIGKPVTLDELMSMLIFTDKLCKIEKYNNIQDDE